MGEARESDHEVAAFDVSHNGYAVRCECGWRSETPARDEILARWRIHVEEVLAQTSAVGE